MILYHGSSKAISKPSISFSRNNTDFGRGFYTTPILEQAQRWSLRFIQRTGHGIVSEYDFDEKALAEVSVLRFDEYSESWLEFRGVCKIC